jgi:hypothetical protein
MPGVEQSAGAPDGTCDLLNQATDPPLGARPKHVPRPQADLTFTPGDTFVLYTDGLIERRGEDIDADLQRLTDALARYARHSPEHLARRPARAPRRQQRRPRRHRPDRCPSMTRTAS